MSTLTPEQKIAFDKIPSAFVAHLLGFGASETAIIDAWNDALLGVKEQRKENGDLRKEAKDIAEQNKLRKSQDLADRCAELDMEVPSLAKSLHRTNKKVGGKVVQVLVGVKYGIEGISGSLDLYVTTGKVGKLTPKVEAKVRDAQAIALKALAAMEDAGMVRGNDEVED